jgi:hypothetical protein
MSPAFKTGPLSARMDFLRRDFSLTIIKDCWRGGIKGFASFLKSREKSRV